ncbi:3-hydroxyacyl-thioester dehydratase HtdZ [soil metagenome]
MKVITSVEDAVALVGQDLGVSDWLRIDQGRIDTFAEATGDHQWIHVDAERTKTDGPYGTTIAHGFLTLSLIPALSKQCYVVENAKMGINYGLNKVRFIAPVPVDSRIRLRSKLVEVTRIDDATVHLTVEHTVDIDGNAKPAAVAEMIARAVF